MVSRKGSQPVTLGGLKHPVEVEPLQEDSPREVVYEGGIHVCGLLQGTLPPSGPEHLSLSLPCQCCPPHHGHQLLCDIPIFCDILTWLSI